VIIPETSVWVDYLNGAVSASTERLDHEFNNGSIATLDLILCEVLQGFRNDLEYEKVRRQFETVEVLETGGKAFAISAALNYRYLRKRGITIRKTIDCLIATYCIENGHILLHKDRDFDPFEKHLGLRVLYSS
jgi:predicted nucleic acid-binding protein